MVGVAGLEPAASWSRTKHTTKLCHTPIAILLYKMAERLSRCGGNFCDFFKKKAEQVKSPAPLFALLSHFRRAPYPCQIASESGAYS